jgi:hypothetical protein
MSLEHSLALVTTARVADIDAVDIFGVIVRYGIVSTFAGIVALVLAIGIAALLDDRPLSEIFNFSNLGLDRLGKGRRASYG